MSAATLPPMICDHPNPGSACFVISALGVIEDVDAAGCALLGYTPGEIIGLHGSELVPRDAHAATAVSLDRMRRGEIVERSGRLQHKDGSVISIAVSARALPDGRLLLQVHRPEPVAE